MKRAKTASALKRRNTPFTWCILVVSFFFFIPSVFIDKVWINLEEVKVDPINTVDDVINLYVTREVIREFRGTYTVSIRRTDGDLVCVGEPEGTLTYKPGRELPIPLSLEWWLGGVDQIENCRRRGFGAGEYFINTCHEVLLGVYELPIAGRCVESNTFIVTE